ncbi:MAG TPA: undecaprenyl-diphosphate phosphatase [Cytophagaceae bacterium]|jgi:undecaprenyl-diphosphatase|nr:undecaprenyl-diphosphate phosphatase [Cytophagaceae bacterium]
MELINAIILAIVEGITEFLPISSTGHMIIVSALMGIKDDSFTKVFEVSIQFGAILSVVVVYFKRFFKDFNFYIKLFCAFLPTAIIGLLLKKHIDTLLERVDVVAFSLLVGGIILLFVDKWFSKENVEEELSYKSAFIVGLFQSISMIPGVSRSASTIIGGLTQKVTRKSAAEFSFFLAVPTMFAATIKSIYDERELVMASMDKIHLLLIGNIVAFVVAMIAIKFFISFLTKYGFKVFGYYRIVLGLSILLLMAMGVKLEMQ